MQDIGAIEGTFDAIIFLASFHHLESQEERIHVLQSAKKLIHPNGCIYLTNWNLRDQDKYTKNHR
jgi:2-polyprenyl-3-methyl-5-hydroxy-6-metoxy-1,4-benzoquinol methylase